MKTASSFPTYVGAVMKIAGSMLSLLLVSPQPLWAKIAPRHEIAEQAFQPICSLQSILESNGTLEIFPASLSAQKIVGQIATLAGISPNFHINAARSLQGRLAIATIYDNKRYIVYDASVYKPTDTQITWQHIGVLAHEIGHHLGGHTVIRSSNPHAQELEADRFSGYASGLLGARLEQALAFTHILTERDSATHPGRDRRKAAVRSGWEQAETLKRLGGLTCTPSWMSPELWLVGGECRVARRCDGNSARVLLACRRDGNNWEWQNWRDVSVNGGIAK